MESRISIDVAPDNQPIIKIDYKPSEDVRDKLVKRFMETFGGQSIFATFHFQNNGHEQSNTQSVIRPLPTSDFHYHAEDFWRYIPDTKDGLKAKRLIVNQVDTLCMETLSPELYQQWKAIAETLMPSSVFETPGNSLKPNTNKQ